uniref:hypothetical protein n=1 Tax=Enterocloster clostridioformis TaxID=1531 RepID=UPI0025AEFFBA|nr:hypothetical protein [Enterocloster clostridioformis]
MRRKTIDKFAGIFCKWFPNTKLETRSMKEKREMAASIERQQQRIDLLSSYESDTHNDVKEIKLMLKDHIAMDNDRTISSFRSTLYRLHMEFIKQGYVTREGLNTFKELGKCYVAAGGDDIYHDKLEPEVLALPIKYDDLVS